MDRLIKTLPLSHGELFYIWNGTRYVLAHCSPELRFYEKSTREPTVGHKARGIIQHELKLILGKETELCRDMDDRFLENTVAFSMRADVYRTDGVYETVYFDRLDLEEVFVGKDNVMRFSVICPWALVKKLSEM